MRLEEVAICKPSTSVSFTSAAFTRRPGLTSLKFSKLSGLSTLAIIFNRPLVSSKPCSSMKRSTLFTSSGVSTLGMTMPSRCGDLSYR